MQRRRPGMKVLFMTGYAQNAIVNHAVLDVDVQLLGKPFTLQGLAAKIREVIGFRQHAV